MTIDKPGVSNGLVPEVVVVVVLEVVVVVVVVSSFMIVNIELVDAEYNPSEQVATTMIL